MQMFVVLLSSVVALSTVGIADASPSPSSSLSLPSAGTFHCGTPERLDLARERVFLAKRSDFPSVGPVPGGTPKTTRDSFGEDYTVVESDNFALKWTNASVSQAEMDITLATLEASWALFVETFGQAGPMGADTFRVNIYISGPNDNPSIDFAGGYATLDGQGLPYMVISEEVALAGLEHVVSHEFYHTVQFGAQSYSFFDHPWYWEATADWASQELYPNNASTYGFVGAYAMLPELSIFAHNNPFGADPVAGVHQYGASILPRFISEHVGDRFTIAQSWETASETEDPLAVLDRLLPEESIKDLFAEFALHTAAWDYENARHMETYVELYNVNFPEHDPFAAHHDQTGTNGQMVSVADARKPRAMGYNVIEVQPPSSGRVTIKMSADDSGSFGTTADLRLGLVTNSIFDPTYTPITVTSGQADAMLDVLTTQPFFLVVSAPSDSRNPTETFGYTYSVEASEPEPEPEPEPMPEPTAEDGGCGCSAPGSNGGAVWLLLGLALVIGRRRNRRLRR